jgi:hypothetical protein
VITCIDPRVDPAEFLGLEFGEAIVARTVGGRVTPAIIQDVAYIGYLVETKAPDGPYFEAAIIQQSLKFPRLRIFQHRPHPASISISGPWPRLRVPEMRYQQWPQRLGG